ncbi:MAG: Jag N-terminal domain-containing protein [Acidimicrobiales bacterium]
MMEWVETTARTIEEAQELALDQLGIGADEAEFEVLATPKPGLFGRLRGEARVRARVRPAAVRPKLDRRRGKGAAPTETSGTTVTTAETTGEADASDDRSSRQQRRKHHEHR